VARECRGGGNPADILRTVLAQLGGWFDDYNTQAPHSALEMRSPAEYRVEQLTLRSSR
jgi:transposase InsO family protein